MSTEILVPFGLDSNGNIATTTNPDVQVNQHLEALVSINPGERVMMPTYGVATGQMLFAMNDDYNQTQWYNEVNTAISTWEPNITVQEIVFSPDGTGTDLFDNTVSIDINWTSGAAQSSASSGVQTATVLVGGTVVQDALS